MSNLQWSLAKWPRIQALLHLQWLVWRYDSSSGVLHMLTTVVPHRLQLLEQHGTSLYLPNRTMTLKFVSGVSSVVFFKHLTFYFCLLVDLPCWKCWSRGCRSLCACMNHHQVGWPPNKGNYPSDFKIIGVSQRQSTICGSGSGKKIYERTLRACRPIPSFVYLIWIFTLVYINTPLISLYISYITYDDIRPWFHVDIYRSQVALIYIYISKYTDRCTLSIQLPCLWQLVSQPRIAPCQVHWCEQCLPKRRFSRGAPKTPWNKRVLQWLREAPWARFSGFSLLGCWI